MKRVLFYFFKSLAFCARAVNQKLYMTLIMKAHSIVGVEFKGKPEYIHQDAFLDASGGLTIYEDVVISTGVIILSHDWSILKRSNHSDHLHNSVFKPVTISANSFIGAGAIILPGSEIGKNCIIGAGAVVKGKIPDDSIVIGNPAKIIGKT